MNGLFFGNTATNNSPKKQQIIRGLTTNYGKSTSETISLVLNVDFNHILPPDVEQVVLSTTAVGGVWEIIVPDNIKIYSIDAIFSSQFSNKLKQIEFDIDSSYLISACDAFVQCVNLESISFGESFGENLQFAYDMFSDCSSIKSIEFPENFGINLKHIGAMFYNCTNIQSIIFPNNFGINCENAKQTFVNCSNLKNINFPENFGKKLTDIGSMFENCTMLQSVDLQYVESEMQNIEKAFYNCTSLTLLNIPKMHVIQSVFKTNFVPNINTLTIYYNSSIFYKRLISKPTWIDVSKQ